MLDFPTCNLSCNLCHCCIDKWAPLSGHSSSPCCSFHIGVDVHVAHADEHPVSGSCLASRQNTWQFYVIINKWILNSTTTINNLFFFFLHVACSVQHVPGCKHVQRAQCAHSDRVTTTWTPRLLELGFVYCANKLWLSVTVCALTRATHLEFTSSSYLSRHTHRCKLRSHFSLLRSCSIVRFWIFRH